MARFKTKTKKKKRFLLKLFLLGIGFVFVYHTGLYLYHTFALQINNTTFLKTLLKEGNHHILTEESPFAFVDRVLQFLAQPLNLLNGSLTNVVEYTDSEGIIVSGIIHNDSYDLESIKGKSEYIEDPSDEVAKSPLVYIYNTHQLENYSYKNLDTYNVKPNVMMAAFILREKLKDRGIEAVVETTNITDLLNVNGWNYGQSYKASKLMVESAKKDYPTVKYFIDLHRDSVSASVTKKTIDNKTYARTLFVIGLENKTYEKNLELAKKIHQLMEKKYPGLSRGIYKKEGPGVNGIYNQDLDPNVMLLEVGGVDNTIDEVLNTLDAFAEVLKELIGDAK